MMLPKEVKRREGRRAKVHPLGPPAFGEMAQLQKEQAVRQAERPRPIRCPKSKGRECLTICPLKLRSDYLFSKGSCLIHSPP